MKISNVILTAVVGSASIALAHGPQIQITLDPAGKIQTRQIVNTTTPANNSTGLLPWFDTLTPPTAAYVIPVLPSGEEWYVRPQPLPVNTITGLPTYISGPGYAFRYDSDMPGSNMFLNNAPAGLPNLQGTLFNVRFSTGLQVWNGNAFVDAGDVRLEGQRGSGTNLQTILSDASNPSGVINFGTLNSYSGNPHGGVRWRFLGDGVSPVSPVPDGIYRVGIDFGSTHPGISRSDPVFFLMAKGVDLGAVIPVITATGLDPAAVQFVPEPATLGLLTVAAIALRRRR